MIHCLIQAETQEKGRQRIIRSMQRLGLWKSHWVGRVLAVVGDGSSECFGLEPDAFASLAAEVGSIIHADESGDLFTSYSVAKARNVTQTQEVIRLAVCGSSQPMPVHFVSSTAVVGRRS